MQIVNIQEQQEAQTREIRQELIKLGWSEKGVYRKLTLEIRAGHACAYSGFDLVRGSVEPMACNRSAKDNASRFHARINDILTRQKQFCGRVAKIAPKYDPEQKYYLIETFPPDLNWQGGRDELVLRSEYNAAGWTDMLKFYPFPEAEGLTV